MMVIDGSYGEGGGQVLRTSLALAAITGQPVRIERIRAGRQLSGLRPQHLTAVRAAAAVCGAWLEGADLGALELTFAPGGPPQAGDYTFDVLDAASGGSAGSVGLVLQTVLLPLAFADGDSSLTLRGGTHVAWAPSASYLERVFVPTLARMGLAVRLELVRWGFYPAGGGELRVHITGQVGPLRPLEQVERGPLQQVGGIAAVTDLPAHIPQRMANRAQNVLQSAGLQPAIEPRRLHGSGPGAGIFLHAQYANAVAGFTAYGRPGLPSEQVADGACEELLAYHCAGMPADRYLADQMVLPMALAAGESRLRTAEVSQHLLTNVWVVRQLLGVAAGVAGQLGAAGELTVRGLGWSGAEGLP